MILPRRAVGIAAKHLRLWSRTQVSPRHRRGLRIALASLAWRPFRLDLGGASRTFLPFSL